MHTLVRMTPSRRLLGARLGLLAFVLIAFAPLFSQLRTYGNDGSWLAEMACHDGQTSIASVKPDASAPWSVDACAYCSLLLHSPAVGHLGVGRLRLAVQRVTPLALPCQPVQSLRFNPAQSRGPPVRA